MVEASFLAQRALMRIDGFPTLLKAHGFKDESNILEVGCGQGIRSKIISHTFPKSQVTGIDRSPELLSFALKNKTDRLDFLDGDLYDLPFPDECFDFIYARLVFMHLSDPLKALRSLLRVLKKGGRILIEDADRDCMFFEPAPASFKGFWEKVQEGQRRLGGDPNVGRKIASLMKSVGMENINADTLPITGTGEDIDFLVRTLLPSLNLYLAPEDRVAGLMAMDDLKALATTPEASFYHFWFRVSGQKS
ncbi:MAG TPA: methyltransferase domain-containing protein [Bacteriovoracaceae bacterium]|nr:methyltransferase domain-containing protein [Bacteriovoracaceae bacterium]